MIVAIFLLQQQPSGSRGIKCEKDPLPQILNRNTKFEMISKRSLNFENAIIQMDICFSPIDDHVLCLN